MKNFILTIAIVIAGMVGIAGAQTANEGVVGYQHLLQNGGASASGVSASYTRYGAGVGDNVGVLGLTTEGAMNFDSNGVNTVTVLGGGILKARNNEIVQPYVRVMGGVAVQIQHNHTYFSRSDTSAAFDVGTGIDWRVGSRRRYSIRTGADYLNTGFFNERQHGLRLTAGLVF